MDLEIRSIGLDIEIVNSPLDSEIPCGCHLYPVIEYKKRYQLIDMGDYSFSGPKIHYKIHCEQNNSLTSLNREKNNLQNRKKCSRSFCLNGGRCIPTERGRRYVLYINNNI